MGCSVRDITKGGVGFKTTDRVQWVYYTPLVLCFDGGSTTRGWLWVAATALRGVRWLGFHQKGVCMVYSKRGCLVSGLAAVRGRLVGWQPLRGALVGAVTAQRAVWLGGSHHTATIRGPFGIVAAKGGVWFGLWHE
ncbi:hypothetical protein Tco_1506384 [Tanacetum coccineum]